MTHYLKLAFRHLWRRRLYSIIILLSLTVGFACTNLLMSFLIAETNVDSFHSKKERIFQVFSDDPFSGKGKGTLCYIPQALLMHLEDNYPEVESFCSIAKVDKAILKTDTQEFRDLSIVSTDVGFFNIFDFPLQKLNSDHLLDSKSVILSSTKAQSIFKNGDALGQVVSLLLPDSTGTLVSRDLTVTGIFTSPPEKSHLEFDVLIHSFSAYDAFHAGTGYVLLKDAKKSAYLEKKLNSDSLRPALTGLGTMDYHLDSLSNSYFNQSNRMDYTKTKSKLFIWAGSVICFLILFMASFNFINLLLLSFQSRKKETGIKKTLGVSLKNLFQTTLTEVTIYLLIAYLCSLTLTSLLLPYFNTTVQTSLPFNYLSRITVLSSIGLIVLFLAGIVIAIAVLNQWRIKPISLMQNQTSKVSFNKFLFTIQFVISITMAICTITIIKQMDYVENEPLGFNKNIIELTAPDNDSKSKMPTLKEGLLKLSSIENATVCSGNPISGNMLVMYKLDNGETYSPYLYNGDEDFFKTLNLTLLEGTLPSAQKPGTMVNEKFVSLFNMKNPIGERVPGTESATIVGVVKNFTSGSFKVETPPVIINYASVDRSVLLSFRGNNISNLLPQIEKVWKEVLPNSPFSYRVLQQELMNKYKDENSFFRIVIAFSFTTMIISCFGLFALSWAVVQSKVKEIGIRKVLGARPKNIVSILSITFTKQILIAFIIAAPIGYYLMNLWLAAFVKKIPLSADIFMWSALTVSIVAIVTLGMQTVKAALSNPVNELRSE